MTNRRIFINTFRSTCLESRQHSCGIPSSDSEEEDASSPPSSPAVEDCTNNDAADAGAAFWPVLCLSTLENASLTVFCSSPLVRSISEASRSSNSFTCGTCTSFCTISDSSWCSSLPPCSTCREPNWRRGPESAVPKDGSIRTPSLFRCTSTPRILLSLASSVDSFDGCNTPPTIFRCPALTIDADSSSISLTFCASPRSVPKPLSATAVA